MQNMYYEFMFAYIVTLTFTVIIAIVLYFYNKSTLPACCNNPKDINTYDFHSLVDAYFHDNNEDEYWLISNLKLLDPKTNIIKIYEYILISRYGIYIFRNLNKNIVYQSNNFFIDTLINQKFYTSLSVDIELINCLNDYLPEFYENDINYYSVLNRPVDDNLKLPEHFIYLDEIPKTLSNPKNKISQEQNIVTIGLFSEKLKLMESKRTYKKAS